jgi:microcystin-dependent protein
MRTSKFRSGLAFALVVGLVPGATSGADADVVRTTGSAGNGLAFANYQPSLVLTQSFATAGDIADAPSGGNAAYLGMVHTFAGLFSPFGMPRAQGQSLSTAANAALFSLIGTSYGGNGVTAFALPDLAGKAVVGSSAGQVPIGQQFGSATVTLSQANLPAHDHGYAEGTTSIAGGGQPFDNRQPSLAMSYRIAVNGIYPSRNLEGMNAKAGESNAAAEYGLIGEIGLFANEFQGQGTWLPADGRLLSIADYTALFSLVGTTYGGDGHDTFALPNLVGRTIVGAGQGPTVPGVDLGEVFGKDFVTLSENQMPAHDHALPTGGSTDVAGGNQPFDNQQESLGLNYLIHLEGFLPSPDGDGGIPDNYYNSPFLGEIKAYAGDFAPRGWTFAAGQLLSIAQNTSLFALIGTTYGGDGILTFALPDLRGRTILGSGNGFEVGQRLGDRSTYLTVDNLAAHTHQYGVADGVPEPASWATMIAGFAMAGGALRRRHHRPSGVPFLRNA